MTRSRPRVCSATGSPANWTFVGDRMQFDQLKRREFWLLAGRSSVAEGTPAYRVSMELTCSIPHLYSRS